MVPERLDGFTRLVPEVESHARYGNVIAWLAKIVVDPTGDGEMVDPVDEEQEQEMLLLADGVSGSRSGVRDSEVESRDSGYGKGEDEESRDVGGAGVGVRIEPGMAGLKKRGSLPSRKNRDISKMSTDFDDTMLDLLLERSDKIRRDNQLDSDIRSEKVFYIENDEDEDDLQSSLLHERQQRCTAGQHEQRTHGGAGYETMRVRLLGPSTHRRRTTSTGSRAASGEIFAARGLIRNHFSFNSTASSGYAYRESLVGKGLSVDGGEDLDRLVLLDADLDRWTLANIDRLQEDLDNIRRDIGDINWTVDDLLRSRDDNDDDLADFSSMYSITGTSILNFGSRSRRHGSGSVSSAPRGCEIQDLIRRLDDWDNFPWDNDDGDDNPEFETGEESDFDYDEDRSSWDGQLRRMSLSDCGDDATISTAVHPLTQYSDVIDDGYIDDGYEVLTHLHR